MARTGRPRSLQTCPHCGALPCYQRPDRAAPVADTPAPAEAVVEAPKRFYVGSFELPGGGTRHLYMESAENARAAIAAMRRDPTLLYTIVVDEYEDTPEDTCPRSDPNPRT